MWRSRSTVTPPNFSLTKPTRATIEGAPLFFLEAPQKTDLSRKTKVLPDEKSHGLGTQEESCDNVEESFHGMPPQLLFNKTDACYDKRCTTFFSGGSSIWELKISPKN